MAERRLLIVEDDPGVANSLRWSFTEYQVFTAGDRQDAVQEVAARRPAVVTLDLGLPPKADDVTEGLATLEQILAIAPHTKVIVVTGDDQRENAVRAVALGAFDYYEKPIDAQILRLIVSRAFRIHELEAENSRTSAGGKVDFHGIITGSPAMLELCRMLEKVAPTELSILLLGESGTGKEMFARAIHRISARRNAPLVAINCAAIPDTLLESELFGYEKGAFSGAAQRTIGKIETAQGGTLFLDEIGDMPVALQAKLLRFIQERVLERIGGRQQIQADVRIISATHRNLKSCIGQGSFREDLFYRLSEIVFQIPALRERGNDALVLADHFVETFSAKQGKRGMSLSPSAARTIAEYQWPGNVRELENRIKRAIALSDGASIGVADLDLAVDDGPAPHQAVAGNGLRKIREDVEREALKSALDEAHGNVSAAARILGISRSTLYNLIKQQKLR